MYIYIETEKTFLCKSLIIWNNMKTVERQYHCETLTHNIENNNPINLVEKLLGRFAYFQNISKKDGCLFQYCVRVIL